MYSGCAFVRGRPAPPDTGARGAIGRHERARITDGLFRGGRGRRCTTTTRTGRQRTDALARAELRLRTLQRLLGIGGDGLPAAIDEAAMLLAEAFGADKVDVLLYRAERDTLAAAGTSDTPMGHRKQGLGLDRLAVGNGGLAVRVFRSGETLQTGRADTDREELRGVVEELGVRSALLVPLAGAAGRRGVLSVASAAPERFDADDLEFALAAAGWMGLLLDRLKLAERTTADAEQRGRRAADEELARLSRREQEVAALVAEGRTNAEIAERLVLTEGTVANHVRRILLKLHLRSRAQLAVWAVERGLYRSD